MFKRDTLVPRRTYGLVIPVIAIVAEYFWLEKVKREASEKFLEITEPIKIGEIVRDTP
jgi:hypothetical protein